jgi:predicted O-methyltransferase YrrM
MEIEQNYHFDNLMNILNEGGNEGGGVMQLTEADAELLYRYAMQVKNYNSEATTILEIGRFRAGSTMILAGATHGNDINIVSVDIRDACRHCFSTAYDWLDTYDEKQRIDIRTEDSTTMKNMPISLLFVDGDHSYEGIKKDFIHHWNYLDGVCLVDDYNILMRSKQGVVTFLDEWIKDGYAEVIESAEEMVAIRKLKNWE